MIAKRQQLLCSTNTISADGNKKINQPITYALYWSGWIGTWKYGTYI